MRTLSNFAFAVLVFLPCALIFAEIWSRQIEIAWLADALVIGLLFYLYHVFLNKRAIWIRCRSCKREIGTNTPWVCGACQAKNEHVDDFPFLNRCESCGVEPKAYQCHYHDCGKLIFFTKDELVRNYAFCINPPVVPTEEEVERTDFEKQKRQREYKLHLTNLDIEVKKAEQKFKETDRANRTPHEKIEESWQKRRASTISAAEIFRREKAAIEEKYKNDSEMRDWALTALKEWYEGGDWERIL